MNSLFSYLPGVKTVMAALLLGPALPLSAAVVSQTFLTPIAPNINNFRGDHPGIGVGAVIYEPFWVASPYGLDMDGNGTSDLTFVGSRFFGTNYMRASLHGQNQIWYLDGRGPVALLGGTLLGPASPTGPVDAGWHNDDDLTQAAVLASSTGAYRDGNFATLPSNPQFLGVRFERDGAIHYGWVALSSLFVGEDILIHQLAWETEPGKAIIVGQIPEPSAALLGSGATAALVFRRRRRFPAS